MKKSLLFAALCATLAGCGYGMPKHDAQLKDQLRNPLYAELYYDDLSEQMISIALRDDPMMRDASKKSIIDRTRTRALEHSSLAIEAQKSGRIGQFISDLELVSGEALLTDDILYIGPTFNAAPGPSQRLYITTTVDPRDGEFPDTTAVLIGGLKNQYGAQAFDVSKLPAPTGTGSYRTLVLWDDDLQMLYGFAQLHNY